MTKKTIGEQTDGNAVILPSAEIPFEQGGDTFKSKASTVVYGSPPHTGVQKGLFVTINADPTRFDVAAGTAIKVDRADPLNPTTTTQESAGVTGQLDTNLGDTFSHLWMDIDTGVITTELGGPSTLSDLNDRIYLGQVIHFGGNIVAVLDNPVVAHGSSTSAISEVLFGGGMRLFGTLVSPNGANLNIDVSAGILQQFGRGFKIDPNNPNEYEIPTQAPVPVPRMVKVYNDDMGVLQRDQDDNDLDPNNYNLNGVLTTVPGTNNWTNLRVFAAGGTNDIVIYYGTALFSSAENALDAQEPTFIENPATKQLSPIAKIAIKKGVTDFESAVNGGVDAIIMPLSRRD